MYVHYLCTFSWFVKLKEERNGSEVGEEPRAKAQRAGQGWNHEYHEYHE